MTKKDLHQPNDKLFRAAFGVPENSASFLKATLPPAVAEQVDWSRLHLRHGAFVDSHYASSQTDLLFSAPLAGRESLIYVLFEHQSAPDRWLGLRLLRYMVRIWETCAAARPAPAKLPLILPVVLAQNADRWALDPQFAHLLDLPDPIPPPWDPFVPDFRFVFLQLADLPFDAIPGTPSSVFVLRVMKAARLGQLLDPVVWDHDLIGRVPPEIVHLIVRYILDADVDLPAFLTKISSIQDPKIRSSAMTLADKLRQEGLLRGRQEGRQEGRREALQEAVINVLMMRFGHVPDGLRAIIVSVTEEKLQLLHRAAIECSSLEDFTERL